MQVAWLAHWLIQPPRCSNIKILWGPSIAGVDTVSAHQSRIEEEPMAPSVFHASPEQPATVLPDLTLYASLELSRSTWLVTCLLPDRDKMSKYSTPGGDGGALLGLLERMRARAQQLTGRPVDIVAIQEAGLDGFWVHRLLEANGVESHVVDPASIAVPRRHRRAKTDAIDGETLLRTLMAWQRGEPRVCSMTVPPSPSEEDPRRISRERAPPRRIHRGRLERPCGSVGSRSAPNRRTPTGGGARSRFRGGNNLRPSPWPQQPQRPRLQGS